ALRSRERSQVNDAGDFLQVGGLGVGFRDGGERRSGRRFRGFGGRNNWRLADGDSRRGRRFDVRRRRGYLYLVAATADGRQERKGEDRRKGVRFHLCTAPEGPL